MTLNKKKIILALNAFVNSKSSFGANFIFVETSNIIF
jgi:hypothetical protein